MPQIQTEGPVVRAPKTLSRRTGPGTKGCEPEWLLNHGGCAPSYKEAWTSSCGKRALDLVQNVFTEGNWGVYPLSSFGGSRSIN